LGVLLYTLVYGAMPFDGSNFKRLVKQISSGEYYEPPDKPSSRFTFLSFFFLSFFLLFGWFFILFHTSRFSFSVVFCLSVIIVPERLSSCFASGSSHAARRSGQAGQRRGHLLPLVLNMIIILSNNSSSCWAFRGVQ
jgi:hypothetical protein